MNFNLTNRADWLRIVQYAQELPWVRDGKPLAYRVSINEAGAAKKATQNALQHVYYTEAANQLKDNDAEGYRAYCKLHFGVPILRNADPEYRAAYDRTVRPLDYETKLAIMRVPLDYPVTRWFNKQQMSEYLDAVYQHLTGLGVWLEERAA